MKILLVDDDPGFRRLTSLALQEAGIEHEQVATAQEAAQRLSQGRHRTFDMILLDQELPGMKGSEFLTLLRKRGVKIPVVLVSVRDGLNEKVRALDLGADDYVVKPFEFGELLARVRAVLRRNQTLEALRVGGIELDPLARRGTRRGRPMNLTALEFDVLWLLMATQGRVVSREEFLHRVWELDLGPESNTLQVHISRLRPKLRPDGGVCIETVRGKGYRLIPVNSITSSSPVRGDLQAGTA